MDKSPSAAANTAVHVVPDGVPDGLLGGLLDGLLALSERLAMHRLRQSSPAAIEEFAAGLRHAIGGGGVSVSMDDVSRQRHIVQVGLPQDLVAALGDCSLILTSRRADRQSEYIPDIASTSQPLRHDLAQRVLSAGFVGIFEVILGHGDPARRGLLQVFLPQDRGLSADERRLIRIMATHLWMETDQLARSDADRASAERLRSIVDLAQDAIIDIDRNGVMQAVNAATSSIFGFSARELCGRGVSLLLAVGERARFNDSIHARTAMRDVDAVGRDGQCLCVDITMSSSRADGGRTVVMRDVTLRKASEGRMRESDRLAAIGSLAAGLGHDMSNMLLPMRAHLNAVEAQGSAMDEPTRAAHFRQIRCSTAYLQQLADSMHSLALDPDGEGDGVGSTDLLGWWTHAGPLLAKALPRATELRVEIEDGLPPAAIPQHVLTRAVLNLLINAAEAMPRDRAPACGRVIVRLRSASGGSMLEVVDNGIGMSPAVLRRAFDLFFTTKTRGVGTGLGLALVRTMVERVGGRIELESRLGMGTTVRLRFRSADSVVHAPTGTAAVRVADGRVAAVVAALLGARGMVVDPEIEPTDADVCVVDAAGFTTVDTARWMDTHAPDRLVILGAVVPAQEVSIARIGATIVSDSADLPAIGRALDATLLRQA